MNETNAGGQPIAGTQAHDTVTMSQVQVNQIAMACYESLRVWSEINGDTSKLPWQTTNGFTRESLRNAVMKLFTKLNDGLMPTAEENHEQWVCDKFALGWSVGEVYSAEGKIHPNLVQWHKLSSFERTKDTLFMNVAISLYNGLQHIQIDDRNQEVDAVDPPPPNQPQADHDVQDRKPEEPQTQVDPKGTAVDLTQD